LLSGMATGRNHHDHVLRSYERHRDDDLPPLHVALRGTLIGIA